MPFSVISSLTRLHFDKQTSHMRGSRGNLQRHSRVVLSGPCDHLWTLLRGKLERNRCTPGPDIDAYLSLVNRHLLGKQMAVDLTRILSGSTCSGDFDIVESSAVDAG